MVQRLILIRHGDLGDRCRGRYIGRTDAPLSAKGRRQAAALAGPLARLDGMRSLASPLRRTRETAEIALGADRVLQNTPLQQAVQKCSDARRARTEERGIGDMFRKPSGIGTCPRNTLSDEVCSATQQMSVFQQSANRPFEIDANLREIDFGRWEGMSFAQITAADPAAVDRWAALDGDFTFPDGEGIRAFRERIGAAAERIAAVPANTLVLFTHGGVIRFLICHFLRLPDRHHLLFDIRPASISEIRLDGGKGVLTLLNDLHHLEGC
jgi:broad specificity phosphatase PhoE